VKIRFEDIYISPDKISKVCDPCFTTKLLGRGAGFGLYLSYYIIEQHERMISVEREVWKGAAFTVKLPIIKEDAAS